ncbi:MAG: hypothetical protein ACLP01_11055 [Solirubrobacteraceae bacterium]
MHGSSFSYSGFNFSSDNCKKISYGPGGRPCTGTVKNDGPASLLGELRTVSNNEDMTLFILPFGVLTGSPASCEDDDDPPSAITAESVMELESLNESFESHAYTTVERLVNGVNKTVKWDINRHQNCSSPGGGPGQTDHCQTTTTGAAFLTIHPLG